MKFFRESYLHRIANVDAAAVEGDGDDARGGPVPHEEVVVPRVDQLPRRVRSLLVALGEYP